jgi:hypothetical protein
MAKIIVCASDSFFEYHLGDLHLLIRLIEKWNHYKKRVELFHSENLGSLTLSMTHKLFMLAKFYRAPEHRVSFHVLKHWIQHSDGS